MLQKNLLIFLLFVLHSSLFAQQQAMERPEDTDITTGSQISNIPYGYYIDSLSPQMLKAIDKLDVSSSPEMRIFLGYGVYDKHDKQCKYLDTGITQHDFDLKFHKLKKHSGHTYAISRDKKTVTQCNALAAQFHGYLMVPSSAAENQGVLGRGQPLYEDEGWLGVYRSNCSESYKSILDQEISYTNFFESVDNCEASKLFVYKKQNTSLWSKGSASEQKYCVVELESADATRPVKVCAPWWRIERTYKLPPQEQIMINGVQLDLYSINQATLPLRMATCLEYEEESTDVVQADRQAICKTYYDITMSPVCKGDLIQPECFVDTCEGYFKNVCSRNDIQPSADGSVKDYVWGYIMENGQPTRVKIQDKIRSHAYTCPPSAASIAKCNLTGDVIVYPYQCNPAVCTEYKKCIGDKQKSRSECHAQYPCEEVYGESSAPVIEGGDLVGFRAKCGETMVVNRNINKLSKTTEMCLRYQDIVDVVTEQKKCTVTATEHRYEIDVAITEQDIYLSRDDCVRTNDIDTARPRMNLTFGYTNKGFFNLALVKSRHDGDTDTTTSEAPNPIANDLQYMRLDIINEQGDMPTTGMPPECTATFDSQWREKRVEPFVVPGSAATWSGLKGVLDKKTGTGASMIAVLDSTADVETVATALGFSSSRLSGYDAKFDNYDFAYLGVSRNDISSRKVVIIGGSAINGDQMPIRFRVSDVAMNSLASSNAYVYGDSGTALVRGDDCETFARCGGFYVETQYTNEAEQKVCKFSNNPALADTSPPSVTLHDVAYPEYEETSDVLATDIDGTNDIFSIQEYADGAFGYASNYHFVLPRNNEVFLDGKEIFPIVRQNPLNMNLDYKYFVKQYTQRTKNEEPDIQQGSYQGTSIGVDPEYGTAIGAGVGIGAAVFAAGFAAYAGPVGLVAAAVVLLLADDIKYGDLTTDWRIYEPTPLRYVPNVYGYDLREQVGGQFVYTRERFLSPTLEDKEFEKVLEEHAASKTVLLYNQGYEKSLVDGTLLRPCETSVCGGYPGKGDWYDPWWHERKTTTDGTNTINIIKPVNSLYLGATNTVTVFVPYIGDYIVTAYSSTGNVLGESFIKIDDFVPASANKMSYANINFAMSEHFNLAPGISDGRLDNACRYDNAVEWGGGVSGVYYEHHTPQGNVCAKSNDGYVASNYADYITVRQIKSNKEFKIKMIRPMPYAGRYNLVSYGKLEKRKYICYQKGEPCEP